MAQIDFVQLLKTARDLNLASNKLLLIIGMKGAGKTALVRRISSQLGWPLVNVGKEGSERLLSLTVRQRKLKGAEVIGTILDETNQPALCLDDTEILFDSALAINPLVLFGNLSRNRRIVTTWSGTFDDGTLVYSYPGHPEYFRQAASGFPVVELRDHELHLHLTP